MHESKRQRTFVLQVSSGEPLLEALLEQARAQEISLGHVTGFGVLRAATIDLPAAGGGRTAAYALDGPFEVLALSGKVMAGEGEPSAALGVQLARATDTGLACVGGRLIEAVAEAVELQIVAFDESVRRREPVDRALERKPEARAEAQPPTPSPAEAPGAWAAVAAASEAAEASPRGRGASSAEARVPARGEYVDHKVFGICRVEAVKPDGTMIIKLETGRRKQLKLDALEFLAPKTGGSRVIFPVQVRR